MERPRGADPDRRHEPALALKGQLSPEGPFTVERVAVGQAFAEVARQVWIPRWSLPEGVTIDQPVLSYPGLNVVVEERSAGVHFPVVGLGHRALSGNGWAAGVLLRPGAGSLLVDADHAGLLGAVLDVPAGEALIVGVRAAMSRCADAPGAGVSGAGAADIEVSVVDAVVECFQQWLDPLLDRVDDDARLLNAVCDAAETDPEVRTCADLAGRFAMSERSLQRLVRRRIGLSPKWLIQRRRLQEAAARLRSDPPAVLADIAAELGYSDQAHFTREFGAVVGDTPGRYRARFSASGSEEPRER